MASSVLLFVLALAASVATRPSNVSDGQEKGNDQIDPDSPLILGDMIIDDGQLDEVKAVGISDTQRRWRGPTIPYKFNNTLGVLAQRPLIRMAMKQIQDTTCIRFVERTSEPNYLLIFWGDGCSSYVGMRGGEQPLSLGSKCQFLGSIVHELCHAIGLYHEQMRSDRDDYLKIYPENIKDGNEDQFKKIPPNEELILTPFDFESIMLYSSYAFTKYPTKKTMVDKTGKNILVNPRFRTGLSDGDKLAINKLYNCSTNPSILKNSATH